MNTTLFEIIKMVQSSDQKKAEFLQKVLLSASHSYDTAVERNAQRIGGELALYYVTETAGVWYGEKQVSDMSCRGGNMYHPIGITLRPRKTERDMDWSFMKGQKYAKL